MAQINQRKKVLLLEPNYSNKFPPIGLMKLATYHKQLGYEVVFYKGELKQFVIEQIADKCITELERFCNTIDWALRKDIIIEYIRSRKKTTLQQLNLSELDWELIHASKILEYYKPEFD